VSELEVLPNDVSLDGCGGFGKVLGVDCTELGRVDRRKIDKFSSRCDQICHPLTFGVRRCFVVNAGACCPEIHKSMIVKKFRIFK